MDMFQLLETFGVPITVAVFFGFFIWKQNKFIQDELQKELRESFNRVEGFIIKLIDQQKIIQIGQKGLERSYKSLFDKIPKLYKDNNK